MRSYKNGKLTRTDHRAANPNSVTRRDRVRDPVGRKTIEQEHDQQGRFARSIKANYIDSDGDGLKDMYLRANRNPATTKPDYRNLGTTPAPVTPVDPPAPVIPVDPPIEGPDSLTTELLAPAAGPGSLDASLQPPVAGPGSLVAVPYIRWQINESSYEANQSDYIDTNQDFADLFNSDFSISSWVKCTDISQTTLFYGADNALMTDRMYAFQAGGNLNVYYESNDAGVMSTVNGVDFSDWVHLLVTYQQNGSNTDAKVYVNGTLSDSDSAAVTMSDFSSVNAPRNFFIAARNQGLVNFPHLGFIDEVALFNSALDQSDVDLVYNGGEPGDLSSLTPHSWYRMGDLNLTQGTTIKNAGFPGTVDATVSTAPIYSSDVPTVPNYSISLDGADDFLQPDSEINVSGAKSVSLWFKANSFTNRTLLGGTPGWGYWFMFGSNTVLYTVNSQTVNYTSWEADEWYHLVATSSGSGPNLSVYVNGTVVNTGLTDFDFSFQKIGSLNQGGNIFDGLIDEIGVWNTELSASEITEIYGSVGDRDIDLKTDSGDYSSSSSLLHWYRMGDNEVGEGITVADQGSGGNDLSLINGPIFSTDTPT